MTTQTTAIDAGKLQAFMMKAVGDMGAAATCATILLGEKLGLYRAMAGAGPLTPAQLAEKTKTNQRLLTEWLNAQAASGYVTYAGGKYELPAEHAMALADEESPMFIAGAFDVLAAMFISDKELAEGFRNGKGLGWKDQAPRLFGGTERFFRPGYKTFLTTAWIPALDGVEAKLKAGVKVADVGCGHGASTVIMAQTYPNSKFYGFDYHDGSIKTAKDRAQDAGADVKFETASAKEYKEKDFDLICFFDCLHDMGHPLSAARHAARTLGEDGRVMLVEPYANDNVEDNLTPVGRLYYSASATLCCAHAISEEGSHVLGAQAGEARLSTIFTKAGFGSFRRAAETPFNLILEARR
jgi:2-polyprenyl-3-methyl-5-hydroxy-6-metoxy-1,4-benzoquinol methylase